MNKWGQSETSEDNSQIDSQRWFKSKTSRQLEPGWDSMPENSTIREAKKSQELEITDTTFSFSLT